jgi:hypothetical protein
MTIGPGMAPEALLYALRVFGCDGSTSLTTAAIDWALDPNGDGDLSDHLDIISMSLGSPDGTLDDDTAIAASNSAKLGVITVASAGNEEDSYYVVGSPSVGPRVISVAASINDMLYRTLRVTAPQAVAGDYIATPAAFGGPIPSELTGELAFDTTNPDGCGAFAVGALTGKIAVIRRGTCNFVVKVKAAQEAGAVAAAVVNNVSGTPITMGAVPPDPTITIPAVMITQADGEEMIATLASEAVTASLRDETVPNSGDWVVFDGEDPTNVYLSASFNLTTSEGFLEEFINGVSSADADTAIFNSRVQTLYVSAADVGVTGRSNYSVAGYYLGELISATPTLTYDPTNPGVSLVGAGQEPFLSLDSPGTSTVQVNPAGIEANDSLGILALHFHNSGKDQAEAILPKQQRTRDLRLPSLLGAIRR